MAVWPPLVDGKGQPVRTLAALLIVATWLVGCGGDDGSDTSQQVESACERAMAQAAEVDATQDTVEDLYPAVRACRSVSEWIEAVQEYPDALDDVDPELVLRNICGNEPVSDTELCQQVQ